MILEEKESQFNGRVSVKWDLGWGKYIQIDGLTQSGGVVESIWKFVLKKIKSKKVNIESILVLGLGGGSITKISRKFWSIAKIIGVDIDPVIIGLGKKYLGLGNHKVQIFIEDAFKFCKNDKNKFDLICIDMYVGDNFPEKFESDSFLKLILKKVNKGGIVIFNRLYFGDKRPMAVRFGQKLEKIFSTVEYVYPEANLMLVCRV